MLVAYAHDVMTQGLQRRAAGSPSRVRRLAAGVAARRATVAEPRLLNQFDAVVTFSAKDCALLKDLGVHVPIHAEQLFFELPSEVATLAEQTVVFVGAMFRPENDQAAKWLVSEIWPLVAAEVPEGRLLIVGSGPSAELEEMSRESPGVQTLGFVPDLLAVYRSASVAIAPLVVGAGIKLKVIEALASGVPVIATPVGAEGLPSQIFPGVSDDPRELARLMVDLLRDAKMRRLFGAFGRRWAESAHKSLAGDMESAVRRYREAAARPRG
jgi:glycosyltransferase involved in cell wall biosynthesis